MTNLAIVNIFKALADENRVRALLALQKQELCVCQIVELLQLANSTVSKHMSILKQAGLVESEKKGRWVYYKLAENSAHSIDRILELISVETKRNLQIKADAKKLKNILKFNPEKLCQIQHKN